MKNGTTLIHVRTTLRKRATGWSATKVADTVHSYWWTGNAADLAATNLIAVYPVTGWWRERPHLGRFNSSARYSLIVSIETANVEVDLYTPIVNQATILTELER